jgi:uncharacterized repeat protein (TIGR01451 family)
MAAASGGGRRTVLALVRDNPSWAAAARCTLTSDTERQNLAGFMSALATRYKGVVWQLYNEPDNTSVASEAQSGLGGCFGTVENGVQTATGRVRYARAIEAAAAALHAADPSAQVATGGVASGSFTDQGGSFDRLFLPGVLAQLKQDSSLTSVDYVTVHYYSSQSFLYVATGVDLLGRIEQLRQDTLAAGLTSAELKPVLSDELSFTDTTGISTSDPSSAFNRAQSAYVPKVLARAAAADVRAAFWFWMQDASAGLGSDVPYGLKDVTGARKPAYNALKFFTGVIRRRDQFVRAMSMPKLEGYEFTTVDGRLVQIVWNQQDTAPTAYAIPGTITSVTDAEGNAAAWSGGSLAIGAEPRFVFYVPSAASPPPTATATTTALPGATSTPSPTGTATPFATATVPPPTRASEVVTTLTMTPPSASAAALEPADAPAAASPTAAAPSPSAPLFALVSIGLLAPDAMSNGQPTTLTLVLLNPGALDAGGPLTVQDTLPPELTFSSAAGDGWTCASDDGQLITCTSAPGLPAGAVSQIQLQVNASPEATGTVTNTATVSSPSFDPVAPPSTTLDTLQIAPAGAPDEP